MLPAFSFFFFFLNSGLNQAKLDVEASVMPPSPEEGIGESRLKKPQGNYHQDLRAELKAHDPLQKLREKCKHRNKLLDCET